MVKYVLTGATGALGSGVFKHLLELVPASDIAVSLYNPAGPSEVILKSGVEIRHGDYAKPETLPGAFAGAEKLLLVSYPSISFDRVELHKTAIDAAKQAGVKHIYYTSLGHTDDSVAAVMQSHLATEKYLKESGITYTIVREGIYNETWPLYLGVLDLSILQGQDDLTLNIPVGDGGIAWASQEDLGIGTAEILVGFGYENRTVKLTGSQVSSLSDVGKVVGRVLKRQVAVQVVPEELFVAFVKGKLPDETVEGAVTSFHAIKRGELGQSDPLLTQLLGREPKTVEATIEELLTGKLSYKQALL